jgi:hypothetical protein
MSRTRHPNVFVFSLRNRVAALLHNRKRGPSPLRDQCLMCLMSSRISARSRSEDKHVQTERGIPSFMLRHLSSRLNSSTSARASPYHAPHVTFCLTYALQISFRLAHMADGAGIRYQVHVRCKERESGEVESHSAGAANVHDDSNDDYYDASASKSEAVTDANGTLEFTVALKMCHGTRTSMRHSAEDSAWGVTRNAYPTVEVARYHIHVNEEMPHALRVVA